MHETHHIEEDVYRLELKPFEAWPSPVDTPNNVYLLDGDPPALVNAGHPRQFSQLARAIREAGVDLPEIDRIVYTSWRIDVLGGAKNFPDTDHFVLSPDMVQPRHFEARLDEERRAIRELADRLLEQSEVPETYDPGAVDDFIEAYLPRVTDELDFIPLRNGRMLRAGGATFDVLEAPGPARGHACFFDRERNHLFSGDVSLRGLPDHLTGVRPYLNTLERLIELDLEQLFPNRGAPRDRGNFVLRGGHRFLDNFMSNAPSAMFQEPTLIEFLRRDLGYLPERLPEFVLQLRPYRVIMEELVRSRVIEAEGEGLERRYGTDFDDPRDNLRS